MIAGSLNNVCLSGAAKGADAQWGMCAGMAGHSVIHWSFAGHKIYVPEQEVVRLSNDQLRVADVHCRKANETLKRKFPTSKTWLDNLLRRNWYQVETSSSIYAVSSFDEDGIEGGTAWAIQMFLDNSPPGQPCPAYVFDQIRLKWYQWTGETWEHIETPPRPSGIWAGIGKRDLNQAGKLAIRELMQYEMHIKNRNKNGNTTHEKENAETSSQPCCARTVDQSTV